MYLRTIKEKATKAQFFGLFLFHFIGKAYLACKVFKSSRLRLGVHVGLPNVVL